MKTLPTIVAFLWGITTLAQIVPVDASSVDPGNEHTSYSDAFFEDYLANAHLVFRLARTSNSLCVIVEQTFQGSTSVRQGCENIIDGQFEDLEYLPEDSTFYSPFYEGKPRQLHTNAAIETTAAILFEQLELEEENTAVGVPMLETHTFSRRIHQKPTWLIGSISSLKSTRPFAFWIPLLKFAGRVAGQMIVEHLVVEYTDDLIRIIGDGVSALADQVDRRTEPFFRRWSRKAERALSNLIRRPLLRIRNLFGPSRGHSIN